MVQLEKVKYIISLEVKRLCRKIPPQQSEGNGVVPRFKESRVNDEKHVAGVTISNVLEPCSYYISTTLTFSLVWYFSFRVRVCR